MIFKKRLRIIKYNICYDFFILASPVHHIRWYDAYRRLSQACIGFYYFKISLVKFKKLWYIYNTQRTRRDNKAYFLYIWCNFLLNKIDLQMNFTVSKIWAFSTASFFNTILKPKKNLFVKVSWDSTTCILLEKLWNFFCLNFIFQKCHKCKTLIKVNGQSYRGKLFHEECFTCHACRGSLTGMLCCFWTIFFKRFSVSS